MENIYEFKSLISTLEALLRSKNLTYKAACTACRIHPSYFSRAMKGLAAFSQSQVFALLEWLGLSEEQGQYLLLLWSLQQSERKSEKEFFQKQIKKIQERKLKVSNRIQSQIINTQTSTHGMQNKFEKYYSEAITCLVHAFLTIPEYRNNPSLLITKLSITESKLQLELKKLVELKMIEMRDHKITALVDNIHLPDDSYLSPLNHVNWRLRSIQNIQSRNTQADDYHLSVIFSADAETKEQLKKILLDFVVKAQKKVGDCKSPTDVYHLMLDLF